MCWDRHGTIETDNFVWKDSNELYSAYLHCTLVWYQCTPEYMPRVLLVNDNTAYSAIFSAHQRK